MNKNQVPRINIGITMAGAASAGCYTAGAMDYLFEILQLWQDAKDGKLPAGWDNDLLRLVPQHTVMIDAMGGTSAGGMTTVMAAIYALRGKVNPVSDPEKPTERKDNIMYDSWVLMGDEPNGATVFEKTLSTKDLDESGKVKSLLNSDFIDMICDNAFATDNSEKRKLPYIADDLELVLSHTMLRGVSLAVDFTTPGGKKRRTKKNVEHSSYEHQTISHFKLNYDKVKDNGKYLPLSPFDPAAAEVMKLATMATGAFPIGLKFREFFGDELSSLYIKNITEKIAFNRLNDSDSSDTPELLFPDDFSDPYQFVSIDGGAINNEPFGEVLGILKERYSKKQPEEDYKYALIMIDPFPDVPSKEKYEQPDDLFSIVPAIIGTLWDQAKVKRGELLDAYSSDYYRGQIFPIRWKKKNNDEESPITCGAAMAFSGLLDLEFRHHDFFLGRDNARNFYRTFFSLPCEIIEEEGVSENGEKYKNIRIVSSHPIHKDWTSEMIQMFRRPGKEEGIILLPIIPDLHMLYEKTVERRERNPFKRTVEIPPKFNAEKLFALKDMMEVRVKKMLELTYEKVTKEKHQALCPLTDAWMNKYYRSNWWRRFTAGIGSWLLSVLFRMNKGKIAARVTKTAIQWILKDLEKKGFLERING